MYSCLPQQAPPRASLSPSPSPYRFCCLLGYCICICICGSVSAFVVAHLMPLQLPALQPPLLSPLLTSAPCFPPLLPLLLPVSVYLFVSRFFLAFPLPFFFRFLLLFPIIFMSHNTLSLFWWNSVWVLRAASWRCCFIKTLLTCVWQHKYTEITMQRGSEEAGGRRRAEYTLFGSFRNSHKLNSLHKRFLNTLKQ